MEIESVHIIKWNFDQFNDLINWLIVIQIDGANSHKTITEIRSHLFSQLYKIYWHMSNFGNFYLDNKKF